MKVLFVDDEQQILSALRRNLHSTGWELSFAKSGQEALDKIAKDYFDFIVTDMHMPQMNGAELLEKAAEIHPSSVRIMLSGHSDIEAIERATFVAHQWFSKPCNPNELKKELARINEIRKKLPNQNVQNLVGSIKSLPSPPRIFMRIKTLLEQEERSLHDIANIIKQDPSLTAKILQISNSSFFVNGVPATSLDAAIVRLGMDVVCSIVLLAESFSQVNTNCGFSLEREQRHSVAVARLATKLVAPEDKDSTMIAGLLHDIGKLIFYKISSTPINPYLTVVDNNKGNLKVERKLFGADHTQLAGYLLHLWNFPYSLIEAVVSHHSPELLLQDSFTPGAAIYVANQLINKEEIDCEFIQHFDLKGRLDKWKIWAQEFQSPSPSAVS